MGRIFVVILAVLLAATVGIYASYVHDLTAARARIVGRRETMPTAFGTMEYALVGQGNPMLVVHGAEGGFDQSIDMNGEPTTAIQADAYAELLDRLGVDKMVVVGISAGAWSSMQFAIRHPERCRALVLLGPAEYLPVGTSIRGGAIVSAITKSDFRAGQPLD